MSNLTAAISRGRSCLISVVGKAHRQLDWHWSAFARSRGAHLASLRAVPKDGGANRDRTDDLKLAKLALSQLSYGPVVVEIGRCGGPGKT
jgi:hypothetical protein